VLALSNVRCTRATERRSVDAICSGAARGAHARMPLAAASRRRLPRRDGRHRLGNAGSFHLASAARAARSPKRLMLRSVTSLVAATAVALEARILRDRGPYPPPAHAHRYGTSAGAIGAQDRLAWSSAPSSGFSNCLAPLRSPRCRWSKAARSRRVRRRSGVTPRTVFARERSREDGDAHGHGRARGDGLRSVPSTSKS
jgi:hypothetical protein